MLIYFASLDICLAITHDFSGVSTNRTEGRMSHTVPGEHSKARILTMSSVMVKFRYPAW